jgi:hypothetical protein
VTVEGGPRRLLLPVCSFRSLVSVAAPAPGAPRSAEHFSIAEVLDAERAARSGAGSELTAVTVLLTAGMVEIGVAHGKRSYDKRQALAERDANREIARERGATSKACRGLTNCNTEPSGLPWRMSSGVDPATGAFRQSETETEVRHRLCDRVWGGIRLVLPDISRVHSDQEHRL